MTVMARKSFKECIHNFTPAWFTIVMGTGIVSILFAKFQLGAGSIVLEIFSLIFFFLNLAFFVLFCGLTVARYWLFPETWWAMLSHPAQGLFVGAFPMGAATLINSALIAYQSWNFSGPGFLYTLWGFWWVDLWVSYFCSFGMLYIMMTTQHHSWTEMASVWAVPILTLTVTSSTGGLVASSLQRYSPYHALITTSISLISVIIGLCLATMIITVYLTRLLLHGPPDKTRILSAFIAVGPFAQGGFSLLVNGQNLPILLPTLGHNFPAAAVTGDMLYAVCFCIAWTLWSIALAWVVISLSSIFSVAVQQRIEFSLAYWGLLFPNGVFALLSVQLGIVLESPFFHYFGAIYSILVFLIWVYVFVRTIPRVWNTSIFFAPCLSGPSSLALAAVDKQFTPSPNDFTTCTTSVA